MTASEVERCKRAVELVDDLSWSSGPRTLISRFIPLISAEVDMPHAATIQSCCGGTIRSRLTRAAVASDARCGERQRALSRSSQGPAFPPGTHSSGGPLAMAVLARSGPGSLDFSASTPDRTLGRVVKSGVQGQWSLLVAVYVFQESLANCPPSGTVWLGQEDVLPSPDPIVPTPSLQVPATSRSRAEAPLLDRAAALALAGTRWLQMQRQTQTQTQTPC